MVANVHFYYTTPEQSRLYILGKEQILTFKSGVRRDYNLMKVKSPARRKVQDALNLEKKHMTLKTVSLRVTKYIYDVG